MIARMKRNFVRGRMLVGEFQWRMLPVVLPMAAGAEYWVATKTYTNTLAVAVGVGVGRRVIKSALPVPIPVNVDQSHPAFDKHVCGWPPVPALSQLPVGAPTQVPAVPE